MTYQLDDVEAWSASNDIELPLTAEERRSLKVGALAKLYFMIPPEAGSPIGSEAMFVKVTKVSDGPRYHGHLDNRPAILTDIAYGDEVDFGPEHVLTVAP